MNIIMKRELERLNKDIDKYGYKNERIYRGIKYEMKRHEDMKHWCFYIYYDFDLLNDDEIKVNIECMGHGGITCGNLDSKMIGYDCAHYGDVTLCDAIFGIPTCLGIKEEPVYRDFEYVNEKCLDICEYIYKKVEFPKIKREWWKIYRILCIGWYKKESMIDILPKDMVMEIGKKLLEMMEK